MSTRRKFIQVGIAATVSVAAYSRHAAAESALQRTAGVPNGAFYKVIYDSTFAAALTFAAEAQRLGAKTHGIRGDITTCGIKIYRASGTCADAHRPHDDVPIDVRVGADGARCTHAPGLSGNAPAGIR